LGLWHEENGFKDDRDELKRDLELAGNQGGGSTNITLEKPTKQQLRNTLDALKDKAQPGEEVTFYFGGHGNGGKLRKPGDGGIEDPGEANDPYDEWVWLNDANGNGSADYPDEILTDDELAQMLTGFKTSVTIVVIMDSCYGGGFTGGANDIQETDHVAVIGPSATAPLDPPGIFGGLKSTLTEDAADGGGEKGADANSDGTVTAEELEDWLRGRGWSLDTPDDQNPGKIKNGKSKIVGFEGVPVILPSITPNTFMPYSGSDVILNGTNFADSSRAQIYLVKPDLTQLNIGCVPIDQYGSFLATVTIPDIPSGLYLLFVEDGEANFDWHILSVEAPAGACFIATAAYGTPMAKEIEVLCEFRDEYLLTNPVGEALVELYYKVSPPMAEFITEHPALKPVVRVGLVPAVVMSTIVVNTTPAEKAALVGLVVLVSVALAVWATRRRGRGPQYI